MKNLRNSLIVSTGVVVLAGLVGCASGGMGGKPSKSAEEVMEAGFKGKDPALKGADTISGRIKAGTATEADLKTMVELTRQLALNKPPVGDLASWTQKTKALHEAAIALSKRQPGAMEAWNTAVNCKACHSAHKPK